MSDWFFVRLCMICSLCFYVRMVCGGCMDDGVFACPECSRDFESEEALKRHRKDHWEEERPWFLDPGFFPWLF